MPRTFYKAPAGVKEAVLHALRTTKTSYGELAKQHGVSLSTVGRWADENNIRRMIRISEVNWRIVRCLYEDGLSLSEIQRRTGVGRRAIRSYLRSRNLPAFGRKPSIDPVILVQYRDKYRLSWPKIVKLLRSNLSPETLRKQYLRHKKNHAQEPLRTVTHYRCPQDTNSPRSKPMPSYKTSATTSPTASSPNATASARP